MKRKYHFCFLLLFLFFGFQAGAQSVIGFWKVDKVTVGNEIVTPLAKWTRINEDGTFQSGNGWQQNSAGHWTFDKGKNSFLLKENLGIKDPFGPFKVYFTDGYMIWQRLENGMPVSVILTPTEKLPESTADRVVGLWDLTGVAENNQPQMSTFDPQNQHYLFIRWDRIFVQRTPEGKRETGYWFINAHRPELTLLSQDGMEKPESWNVAVNDTLLILTGISDSNQDIKRVYQRIYEFPK